MEGLRKGCFVRAKCLLYIACIKIGKLNQYRLGITSCRKKEWNNHDNAINIPENSAVFLVHHLYFNF